MASLILKRQTGTKKNMSKSVDSLWQIRLGSEFSTVLIL